MRGSVTVTIIAECGVNHDGSLDKALKLCDAAKLAGADIVKFQTYIPEKCIRPGKDFALLKRLALDQAAFLKIAQHCGEIGIEFCSTPDDLDSLKFLVEDCGVKRIKLGSGSLRYRPLVDAAFDTGLPVLLSTGMATDFEVRDVMRRQNAHSLIRQSWNDLTVMHCVSIYPCPPQLANMAVLRNFGRLVEPWWDHRLKVHPGYSDHTLGNYAVLAAVALGATVIEKHMTLDNEAEGPDHRMSATPEQFETMVMKIRQMEIVLGDGCKEPSPEEAAMIPLLRKDENGFQRGL